MDNLISYFLGDTKHFESFSFFIIDGKNKLFNFLPRYSSIVFSVPLLLGAFLPFASAAVPAPEIKRRDLDIDIHLWQRLILKYTLYQQDDSKCI